MHSSERTYVKLDTFLVKKAVRYMKDNRMCYNDNTTKQDGTVLVTITD